jgi:xanthine dehydrogenase YagS FAD-binding subunit
MRPFAFARAATLNEAIAAAAQPGAALIAGGTEMLNWLKEAIVTPSRLIDLSRVPALHQIEADASGLRIGALARMSDVAAHAVVRRDYPAISEALLKSASPQIRNMATMGGNLLQRTRCPYFRAETDLPCNKRRPGSGCGALQGDDDRTLAIFGGSPQCIATHPSDVAVAFAALNAIVHVQGAAGPRRIPLTDFYRLPGEAPERETELAPGEVIVRIDVPASAVARRSHYLKLRERASYEFALVSAAVALDLDGRRIRTAQIALGGVAPKPWRITAAEDALRGVSLDDTGELRAAVTRSFADAQPRKHNGFKVELAARMVVRGLQHTGGLS